ncbi:T3SS component protein [Escherichia coli O26:H11 str. CVM9952]|uniref:T3SS component n=1 Tax=Escherichia coli TaxID=562 RepID=A0A377ADY5_ECOLX|nr:T3SS component protein [Escherichia coli O111:H11 str. CVM9553]EJE95285.1 T3SS component protein [Escherichia coli O26:H11 str. CVM9952]STL07036.1 T3SS component [Escherichia coli]
MTSISLKRNLIEPVSFQPSDDWPQGEESFNDIFNRIKKEHLTLRSYEWLLYGNDCSTLLDRGDATLNKESVHLVLFVESYAELF